MSQNQRQNQNNPLSGCLSFNDLLSFEFFLRLDTVLFSFLQNQVHTVTKKLWPCWIQNSDSFA